MTDGTRTRDSQYHKLELYQLSYGHQGFQVCHTQPELPPATGLPLPNGPFTTESVVGYAVGNVFRKGKP